MDWSSFWGAFIGNVADIAVIIIIIKGLKAINKMLKEFKKEGRDEEWLK